MFGRQPVNAHVHPFSHGAVDLNIASAIQLLMLHLVSIADGRATQIDAVATARVPAIIGFMVAGSAANIYGDDEDMLFSGVGFSGGTGDGDTVVLVRGQLPPARRRFRFAVLR